VNFWPTTPPKVRRVWVESLQDAQDIVGLKTVTANIADIVGLDKRSFSGNTSARQNR